MSALMIENLNCFYQKNQILRDLQLQLDDNEIVCLLGESGCGKTTLLRAVAGLQASLDGEISINNQQVNAHGINTPPEQRKVGLIFQDYALFPHLNVFDNIAFSLFKMDKKQQAQRVEEVLALVQLSDFAQRFPHQLSGGQQQRIAIARALAYQPDLMLLDEPFSNLDQHVRFQLIQEIRRLLKKQGMSALFVTHSKEEGFAFADKIALMRDGQIIQIGAPQQLYSVPNCRYVADFMGHSNYVDVDVQSAHSLSCDFGVLTTEAVVHYPQGTTLKLLVRPEQFVVNEDKMGEAEICDIHFLGALLKMSIQFQGHVYTVQQSNEQQRYQVGDRVTLSIRQHQPILFDA